MSYPHDVAELRQRVRGGWRPEFVLFLAPDPPSELLSNGCLSQWYAAPMTIDGVRFATAEHYMMWRKAQVFDDVRIAQQVLADERPDVAKRLGREVRGFDAAIWNRYRHDVVLRGSFAKFEQHERLRDYLLQTRDSVLAEASPVDDIWGIGFAADDARAKAPLVWTGLNLLGFILMQVREHFQRKAAL